MQIAITITIPKLTTILAHWRWGLLAVFALAFMLTSGGSGVAPSVRATDAMPCSDIDGDGEVTETDFDIVVSYFNQLVPPAPPQVDLDGNNQVGFPDFNILLLNMGIFTDCQDKPVTFKGKGEININPVQKNPDPGPPPFGCYQVLNDVKALLFTVCDNDAQEGFPESLGICDVDGTEVCEDSDPAKGKIRVSVFAGVYNVVESKPPPNYDPTNSPQQSCTTPEGARCEVTFQNTAQTVPWFPWDVDGDGGVSFLDFLAVKRHFNQTKCPPLCPP